MKIYKSKIDKTITTRFLSLIMAVLMTAAFLLMTEVKLNDTDIFFNPISVLGSSERTKLETAGVLKNINATVTDAKVDFSEYEISILNLINSKRNENGLASLKENQILTDVSRIRSNDMLNRDYFSHYTPEGTTVFNILRSYGVKWKLAGENLAFSEPANLGSPEAFMDAWMNSPGHAENILRSSFKVIGIGMTENGDKRVVTTVFKTQ